MFRGRLRNIRSNLAICNDTLHITMYSMLHIPSLEAIGLWKGYETLHPIGCCHCLYDLLIYTVTEAGGCVTNVSRALQNNLAKIHNAENHIHGENFKLKLCTCAQSMALSTRTKFQHEILIRTTISVIHKFCENILESLRNISETTPRCHFWRQVATPSADRVCPTRDTHVANIQTPHCTDLSTINQNI